MIVWKGLLYVHNNDDGAIQVSSIVSQIVLEYLSSTKTVVKISQHISDIHEVSQKCIGLQGQI